MEIKIGHFQNFLPSQSIISNDPPNRVATFRMKWMPYIFLPYDASWP